MSTTWWTCVVLSVSGVTVRGTLIKKDDVSNLIISQNRGKKLQKKYRNMLTAETQNDHEMLKMLNNQ